MRRLLSPCRSILAPAVALMLAACGGQQTISNNPNPVPDIVTKALAAPVKDAVAKDLTTTAANFDAAASLGLPGTDVYASCAHLINQQLGIEAVPNAPAFQTATLNDNGVVSHASEIIIAAIQLQQLQGKGISIPQNCVTAFGMLNIQNLSQLFTKFGALPINVAPAVTPNVLKVLVAPAAPAAPAAKP